MNLYFKVKSTLAILTFTILITNGLKAQQNNESDTLDIFKKSVVFYSLNQLEYDSLSEDKKSEVNEILSDFFYYSNNLGDFTNKHGIDQLNTTKKIIKIKNHTTYFLKTNKDYGPIISIILIDPNEPPKIIKSVFTDVELIQEITVYFNLSSELAYKFNWDSLSESWHYYLTYPSGDNALKVYHSLPEKENFRFTSNLKEKEIIDCIFEELNLLERQIISNDRNAVKLAFKLYAISDGVFTESLNISLGKLIRINPNLFLEELKIHRFLVPRLSSLLGNLGQVYVDKSEAQRYEIKMRIASLKQVQNSDLIKIRNQCLEMLEIN